eukprot:138736_1
MDDGLTNQYNNNIAHIGSKNEYNNNSQELNVLVKKLYDYIGVTETNRILQTMINAFDSNRLQSNDIVRLIGDSAECFNCGEISRELSRQVDINDKLNVSVAHLDTSNNSCLWTIKDLKNEIYQLKQWNKEMKEDLEKLKHGKFVSSHEDKILRRVHKMVGDHSFEDLFQYMEAFTKSNKTKQDLKEIFLQWTETLRRQLRLAARRSRTP